MKEIISANKPNPSPEVSEVVVMCDQCRQGFFVNAPKYLPRESINQVVNKRYPSCPGHPVYETIEILEDELKRPQNFAWFRERKPYERKTS